jgi:hypothetical protein
MEQIFISLSNINLLQCSDSINFQLLNGSPGKIVLGRPYRPAQPRETCDCPLQGVRVLIEYFITTLKKKIRPQIEESLARSENFHSYSPLL